MATRNDDQMGNKKQFGRYEVGETIGRGAMGVVYLAEDPVIGRKVAIKVVEGLEGLEKDARPEGGRGPAGRSVSRGRSV